MAHPASQAFCWAAGLVSIVMIGCATPPRIVYSPDALRAEVVARSPELRPEDVIVPFELSQEPIAMARALLRNGREAADRVHALIDALSDPEAFGLRYEWAASGTASETLERGSGNCFSLSSVLVGLSRAAGLRAYYVEVVLDDRTWRQEASVAVQADHIATAIETGEGRVYIDFSGQLSRVHSVRVIDDIEALAHFYNNRGYEKIHDADVDGQQVVWADVAHSFEIATRVFPGLARAWNNLGVARARLGDVAGAIAAYRTALEHQSGLQSAHVNLAVLHLREGEYSDAAIHVHAARALDPRNPQIEDLLGQLPDRLRNPDDSIGG
jgi:tetratricopeptide (TPR) repeat protein